MNNKTGRNAAAGSYGVKLRSRVEVLTKCHQAGPQSPLVEDMS